MKFVALILSIFVLTLSVVPCSVLEPAFGHGQEQCSTEKDHHAQGDDCSGLCSPFYTCGTCLGLVLIVPVTYPSTYLSFESTEHYVLYLLSALREPLSSIWQPPRIG
ncbi:DUF6660 family protein [Olivibacter sp. SDN3]|uniref:DUF6660 family protein n=1 Tax=Olivibacter sp. SDN3 TaxID=2764720 RepID=UPI00351AEF5B